MPKKKIHFIGFLANVDDSILKLNLGNNFIIEKRSQQEVMPFLREIDFDYGIDARANITAFGCYCVRKPDVTEFESTPEGCVGIQWGKHEEFHRSIQDRLRLLRLFKEGNISLEFSFMYHLKDSQPSFAGSCRLWPVADRTKFHLNDNEVSEAQSFIKTVKIPFEQSFLQLAFEIFELSYEVHNPGLAFLALMICLETMLNPDDRELRYRISRNAAVLLGSNPQESERIFSEVKGLYDKRSKLVHTGENANIGQEDGFKLRGYVREAIKEMNMTGQSKDELLRTLHACGFGQRPWRNKKE